MLSLPLVQVIDISGHNRNRVRRTLPITSLISALRRNRHNASDAEDALPAQESHARADKSTRGPAARHRRAD
jgi:hypothetical protein